MQGVQVRGKENRLSDDTSNRRKLSKGEARRCINRMRHLIGKNYTDDELAEELKIRSDQVQVLRRRIYQTDKVRFQTFDKYAVYSDYVAKSTQMVKELDEIKTKFRNRGQWTALVAAVKQKGEIYDKVIKLGQEFGFIDRKATEIKVEGEMSFSTMSDADMKAEIAAEVAKMHKLASGQIVDMRPELIGVTNEEVASYVPANLLRLPEGKPKTKIKTKIKVTLKKRIP